MKYTELLKQLTLEEKCALLTGQDVWHTRAIARLGIPAISMSDGPSGLRKQAGEGDHLGLNASTKATCIPSAATMANSWNPEVAEQMGAVVGAEAAAQNVQVLLGPGLNTKRNPLCGRNFEYYSEDPFLSGKLAAGFIRGVQSKGVSACAKHFAVNSQETVRMHSDSVVDERTLREMYLTNFEIAVKEGKPHAVMSAYNRVNGVYANENAHLLQEILRDTWGFDGAVITDWGGSNDVVEGVRAGMNLEMPGSGDDSACQLVAAVKAGKLPENVVDQRVDELLTLVFGTMETKKNAPKSIDAQAHHALAGKAAEESAVLLKNEGGVLPLASTTRVAVIGDLAEKPRFQGAGSSMVNASSVDETLALLPKYFAASVGYAQGYRRLDEADEALAAQAEALAAQADCVLLYMGLTESFETEGLDRTHMRLPQNQIALLKRLAAVNTKIIVVLATGSAVETPWIADCQALLLVGLGGQAGAGAALRVLTGEVNPSGKLSETWPMSLEDMPSSRYYPGKEATAEYREGLYVGYRATESAQTPVRFPFGFGLSYTSFAYANITASETQVAFDLTNTGDRAGSEVTQVYVALPGAQVFRPAAELKGFAKITLAAGETRRVTIALDDKAFRYFNVNTNRFEIEGGTYEVRVGASVQDIRLTGKVDVKGTNAPNPYAGVNVACYAAGRAQEETNEMFAALLGRAIPKTEWDIHAPLTMNDTVSQLFYAKNPLARGVYRMLKKRKDACLAAGKPDLNLLFIYNIPFRGMAKMMNGMITLHMAEGLLRMANGHFFRGLGRVIGGFCHRPSLKKELEEAGK